jgi:hypothetical protein
MRIHTRSRVPTAQRHSVADADHGQPNGADDRLADYFAFSPFSEQVNPIATPTTDAVDKTGTVRKRRISTPRKRKK